MAAKKRRQSSPSEGEDNESAAEPVRALRRLPNGPLYRLPEWAPGTARVQWLTVGSDTHCDLVIDELEAMHCSIRCMPECVTVEPFPGATTAVNTVPVVEGHAVLQPSSVLTLGVVNLVVCGNDLKQAPRVSAVTLGEMAEQTLAFHKNPSRAADALGIKHKTNFYRWLKKRTFTTLPALGGLCLLVGVGHWIFGADTDSDGRTVDSVSIAKDVEPPQLVPQPADIEESAPPRPAIAQPAPAVDVVSEARPKRRTKEAEPSPHRVGTEVSKTTPVDEASHEQRSVGGMTLVPTRGQGVTLVPTRGQGMTLPSREGSE